MRDLVERIGMIVGWALIGLGNAIGFVAEHGLVILGAATAVVGAGCQVYTTWMRHQDFVDRRKRRSEGQP